VRSGADGYAFSIGSMGRHEVGDGAVFLVGEERCGWQWVMEVEDDRGWNRFWVKDKNFFGGKADEGGSSRKTDRGLRFWEIGFMRRLRRERAENGVGSGQP
jgi:hypothetical protein